MTHVICSSRPNLLGWMLAILPVLLAGRLAAEDPLAFPPVNVLKTDTGVPFAILGEKPNAPAPTLFVFGSDMRTSLTIDDGNKLGRLLIPHGYLCVSLDIPCHGADVRPGEAAGNLAGWKTRIVAGEKIIAAFTQQVSKVLDYLIAEKYTDPERVGVAGTSRGGFIALHCGAAEPRIKQVIAFAPVTHLPALREFAGAETNADVLALSPIHVADKLVGKRLWIVIGNNDLRVGTDDCIAFAFEVIKRSKGKLDPIPVDLRIIGSMDHRLHASPKPEYGQFSAPHDEAATWMLSQAPKK